MPLALLLALPLALMSCGDTAPSHAADRGGDDARPLIVVTTTMIGDLAQEIAGDDASVQVLFGPHIDPHLFRPTRDDVALLMGADLVVYNGFGLEGYLAQTLRRVGQQGTDVLAIAEVILEDNERLLEGSAPDPHVWMDPSLWQRACGALADAIVRELPADDSKHQQINSRATAVAARLAALDASSAERLAGIPASSRVLVTAHDAFGYFGRRYDMEVLGIQGVSTASEAGLLAIEQLVERLVTDRIGAVFFESTIDERNIRALIEGAAARGHGVSVGGVLHSDAPSDAGSYEAMIEHNVATIASALGGTSAAKDTDGGAVDR